MRKFSTYCFFFFFAFTAIAQEKTSIDVQLNLQNQTGSPYFCEGSKMTLIATPNEPGFSYQWFLDGKLSETTTANTLPVRSAGNYSVIISNSQKSGTSSKVSVNACPDNSAEIAQIWAQSLKDGKGKPPKEIQSVFTATISSVNPILCNGNTSATLVAQPQGPQYTYQWQYASCLSCTYTNQSGQTNNSLTATTTGYYKVIVTENSTTATANPFRVSYSSYATLTDQSDNPNGIVNVAPGQSASLKVNFTGTGPFYFTYNDGVSDKTVNNVTTNPYTLVVTPNQNRRYKLVTVGNNSCGSSGNDLGTGVRVVVDASTSVALPTPASLNVCAGSTIEVPYTTVGTWIGAKSLIVQLISEQQGYTVNTYSGQSDSPLRITIPSSSTPYTQYRIGVLPVLPASVVGPVISPYILTVTNIGCLPKPIVSTSPANQACNSIYLSTGNPISGSSSNYQWFRNGMAIASATSSGFYAYESGDYYVKVTNAAANYIDSSAVHTITLLSAPVTITSPNTVLCGNNTTAVLTASTATLGGTWQWYKSNVAISGATDAIYTATTTGEYRAEYTTGACTATNYISVTNYPSAAFTTLSGNGSQTIAPGTSTQLKATFTGQGPWTFQLYDGSNYKNMSATANPYLITVQPEQNRSYSLSSIRINNCNNTGGIGNVTVVVDPNTSFTFPSPTNINVCAGSTIEIPYVTSGTWTNDRKFSVELYDTGSGNYISSSYQYYFSENPIRYTLPSTLSLNSVVRVSLYPTIPAYAYSTNTYYLTVTNTGCQPTATIKNNSSVVQCSNTSLYAYPQGTGYVYQWFMNGNAISGATNYTYNVTQTGSYTVQVSNPSTSYSSTSSATNVTITMPAVTVNTTNNALCSGGSVTLSANPSDPGTYNYQWYFLPATGGSYSPLNGADQTTYVATAAGYYYVSISPKSGNCAVNSSSVNVSVAGSATLTNAAGNNSNVIISPGQTTQLKVVMTGQPPFTFKYYDGTYERRVSTNSSEYILNVTPEQNRNYYLGSYGNACGNGNTNGSVAVLVDASTSINLLTPGNLNACVGGTIEIPYTVSGTWGSNQRLNIGLTTSGGGGYYYSIAASTSPLLIRIPDYYSVGTTFKVSVEGQAPYFSTVSTGYNFTVTGTGCLPKNQIYVSNPRQCGSAELYTESISNYNYQWYRDGNSIGYFGSNYVATVSGNYAVRVTGPNNYDFTTASMPIVLGSVPKPTISRTGSTDCNSTANFTLTSNINTPSFSYQWYYAPSTNGPYLPVTDAGGTSPSLTTNKHGIYIITVESGSCQSESYRFYTCPILVDFSSASICQNGSVTVNFSVSESYNSSTVFTLNLVDAVSGTPLVSNLATLTGFNQTFTNVLIPVTVAPGSYRFVVSSSNPTYKSPMSAGIMTVTNNIVSAPPTLTAAPYTLTPGESTTLTASNCNGTIRWSDNTTAPVVRTITPSGTTTYYAVCIETNGCTTAQGSVTVTVNCDNFEPNNSYQTATPVNTVSYLSPQICLDSGTDEDWYTYIYNNRVYYIKVTLYSTTSNTGYYKLSVGVVNDSLQIETLSSNSSSIDTYIRLYSNDGITQLGFDDDSGVNAFSLLKYKLPSPCSSVLSLYSTLLDIAPGQTNTAKALQINATNKVGDGATANYYGQNAVLLLPGFQTNLSTGGSFNASIQGCN